MARGKRDKSWESELSVDLHGKTRETALRAAKQAVFDARRRGFTHLEVIVGRGAGTRDGKAVIKPVVERWLRGPEARAAGVKDTQAGPGGGAFRVLLVPPERTVGGAGGYGNHGDGSY
ncbi:MAG: hypothetical protein CMK00_00335 [Planctomycetes bacterium]|jgi:DNA-nicking Smr family endonuclease|nr:hypothetical protein [Planctomycetota bacterium]HJO26270.1 Smr/MutS family protein [Planctomycetota bacterium]